MSILFLWWVEIALKTLFGKLSLYWNKEIQMFDFVLGTLALLGVLYLVIYGTQLFTSYMARRNRVAVPIYETATPRRKRRQYQ